MSDRLLFAVEGSEPEGRPAGDRSDAGPDGATDRPGPVGAEAGDWLPAGSGPDTLSDGSDTASVTAVRPDGASDGATDRPGPVGAPHSGPDTSRAAAERIAPGASGLAVKVFGVIAARGDDGATDFEIQESLGMSGDTERPRRWELERDGLIHDSGRRRKSPSGRAARVYVATAQGTAVQAG